MLARSQLFGDALDSRPDSATLVVRRDDDRQLGPFCFSHAVIVLRTPALPVSARGTHLKHARKGAIAMGTIRRSTTRRCGCTSRSKSKGDQR